MNELKKDDPDLLWYEAKVKLFSAYRRIVEHMKEGDEPLYMEKNAVKLEPHHIKAAETVLSKGDRVELIPVKDGVKVMMVRREEVKEDRPG